MKFKAITVAGLLVAGILVFSSVSRAQEGEPVVVDEVIAQVNDGVHGQLLVAEGLHDLRRLLRPGQGAVRLHVAQSPFRRQHRRAG